MPDLHPILGTPGASLQMLEQFTQLSEHIVHIHDFQSGRLVFVNQRFGAVLGYEPAAVARMDSLLPLVNPDDLPQVQAAFGRLADGREPSVTYVFRARHSNGEWRSLRSRISVFDTLPDGTPRHVAGITQDITEGATAQEKLHNRQLVFNEAERLARMGYWERDVPNDRLEWSEGMWQIFGYAEAQARPRRVDMAFYLAHLPPSEHARVQALTQSVREEPQAETTTEITITTAQGVPRRILNSYRAFYAPDGSLQKLIGCVLDITERERDRERQQALQTMLEEAERSFGYGTWVWDLETSRVTWSVGMWLLLGFQARDYTGQPQDPAFYFRFVDPADIPALEAGISRMMESGQFPPTLQRVTTLQGEKRIFEARGKQFEISGRRQVLGSIVDVTERQQALERLVQSEQLVTEAEKLFRYGSWSLDTARDEMHWSAGMIQLLGYTPETFGDNPKPNAFYLGHIHPDDRAQVEQYARQFAESDSLDYEGPYTRLITRQGEVLIVKSRGRAERANGRLRHVIGSTIDFTGLKKAEAELEHKVAELARSNAELEQFAYVASHDLQEPLRKVRSFSGLLVREYGHLLDSGGTMYLDRIQHSVERMQVLIDDLLTFSRMGRTADPFQPTDLADVLQQAVSDADATVRQTGATVDAGPLPVVEAIPVQMQQLFANLLGNALKFSRPGVAPHITVRSQPLTHAEKQHHNLPVLAQYVCITVADNGIGFDPEYAEKIFVIFQRLHGRSEYSGTGIGLAVCKRIADNHHGLLFAEGRPGQGATFTVILPERQ